MSRGLGQGAQISVLRVDWPAERSRNHQGTFVAFRIKLRSHVNRPLVGVRNTKHTLHVRRKRDLQDDIGSGNALAISVSAVVAHSFAIGAVDSPSFEHEHTESIAVRTLELDFEYPVSHTRTSCSKARQLR